MLHYYFVLKIEITSSKLSKNLTAVLMLHYTWPQILNNDMVWPWINFEPVIAVLASRLKLRSRVHCICVAVSCSGRISISAPTTALRHCKEVNLRCSALRLAVVDKGSIHRYCSCVAADYERTLKLSCEQALWTNRNFPSSLETMWFQSERTIRLPNDHFNL